MEIFLNRLINASVKAEFDRYEVLEKLKAEIEKKLKGL